MKVYINGLGITQFGDLWGEDLRTLSEKAANAAIADSGIDKTDIDAIYVANMAGGEFGGQAHLGALIADSLKLKVPALRVEGACASGSLAINLARIAVLSGVYKNVLVVGVEKMSDINANEAGKVLASAADEERESFYGVTFPSLYAMITRAHMHRYQSKREDLALVSVKNHHHGVLNPKAQFRKEISVESVLSAPDVASPLGLFDCSPLSDGAAAVIISANKTAKSYAEVVASEIATSSLALSDREDITTLDCVKSAANKAYTFAGISADDIAVAEVHDCFSIAEVLAYEDLGFAKRGEGHLLAREGATYYNARRPVNTSGGLKACGHPVAATGIKQAIEVCLQLTGKAEGRQVEGKLQYALTHNVGGSGATSVINIFKHV